MIEVLGHRGCAGLEPENTIRALKKAQVFSNWKKTVKKSD